MKIKISTLFISLMIFACSTQAALIPPAKSTPTNTVSTSKPVSIPVVVKQEYVYFRSQPSRSSSGVVLNGGTQLIYKGESCVVDNSITWVPLWLDMRRGWMSAAWVEPNVCK